MNLLTKSRGLSNNVIVVISTRQRAYRTPNLKVTIDVHKTNRIQAPPTSLGTESDFLRTVRYRSGIWRALLPIPPRRFGGIAPPRSRLRLRYDCVRGSRTVLAPHHRHRNNSASLARGRLVGTLNFLSSKVRRRRFRRRGLLARRRRRLSYRVVKLPPARTIIMN